MKVEMRLVLDYDIGETEPAEAIVTISDLLSYATQYMAGNGLMSGDTLFEVVSWECHIDTVEE